ncbi:multiple sugar transport system permease protein [Allocatelliglobosispora scoriae]|uniref:Multiple sugar transport system permease protein n=1 Tax=Allocatelliglobosispora scoriae TaxID=643052 RepID=A0A841C430_9ACTN|nr:sugar ABC transporter permease [Allocatelliglobosispora scoriae]MBB5874528.1 multiple sugar transport system permease protein [Allocatelliglobosispora scoriae]
MTSAAPARSRRHRRGPMARRQRLGLLFVAPAVLLVLGMFILPVIVTGVMSFYDWSLLGQRRFVGLANYERLAHDTSFRDSLGFTTVYTVIATAALLVVGMVLASAVRHRRRGVGLLRTAYVVPVVIGFATASYVTLWLLDDRIGIIPDLLRRLGVVDGPVSVFSSFPSALAVVVVLVVWKTVGLTMLLLMTGMQAISKDYYEAAQVDGASRLRTYFKITLPLLRPTIGLVLILTVIGSYLAFDQFFILTQGGPDNSTIPVVYLIYRAGFIDFNLGYSAAMSIALMVILLILTSIQLLLTRTREEA